MNSKNSIEFNFIDRTSVLYSKAINLRYNVFFEPIGINKKVIYDRLEEKSLHLVAISKEYVLGYARLLLKIILLKYPRWS